MTPNEMPGAPLSFFPVRIILAAIFVQILRVSLLKQFDCIFYSLTWAVLAMQVALEALVYECHKWAVISMELVFNFFLSFFLQFCLVISLLHSVIIIFSLASRTVYDAKRY